jgi:hypothetical protein
MANAMTHPRHFNADARFGVYAQRSKLEAI